MKIHRILILAFALLALPAVASATALPSHAPAVPSLDAFLASLSNPAATAVDRTAKATCGSGFCTQAQRDACTQQCIKQHHSFFVGLECCSDTCTTICICGSVPVNC
jgi:hypothetical protein